MGKKKLNAVHFYQCDWTGYPMAAANCYFPTWTPEGKLQKKGAYCNWESVLAHAHERLGTGELTEEQCTQVVEHVSNLVGCQVYPAPDYRLLTHCGGTMSLEEFHTKCTRQGPISAIHIDSGGGIKEISLNPDTTSVDSGQFIWTHYLNASGTTTQPSLVYAPRKKKLDRDVCVISVPDKRLAVNATASQLFKMQIHGDVLLVYQTREACFQHRTRFTTLTRKNFDELFAKKRKRTSEERALDKDSYNKLKSEMQSSLDAFEKVASITAQPPRETSQTLPVAPMSGHHLAKAVKAREAPNGLPVVPAILLQAA